MMFNIGDTAWIIDDEYKSVFYGKIDGLDQSKWWFVRDDENSAIFSYPESRIFTTKRDALIKLISIRKNRLETLQREIAQLETELEQAQRGELTPEEMLQKLSVMSKPRIGYSDTTNQFYLSLDAEILPWEGSSVLFSVAEHRATKDDAIRAAFERYTAPGVIVVVDAWRYNRRQYKWDGNQFVGV